MPMNRKPELYRLLKANNLPMSTSYMQYTTAQLLLELSNAGIDVPDVKPSVPRAPQVHPESQKLAQKVLDERQITMSYPEEPELPELQLPDEPEPKPQPQSQPTVPYSTPRKAQADPDEMAGQRLNTHQVEDEPIRIDDQGRIWYQEEVRKPAYPKPRGRRVLKYIETGTKTETVQNGEYIETFEVAGQGPGRPAEVKITLPSYQVGIYKDPRFPFKIHVYNDREGFDLFEVNDFYGAAELVPETIKRVYIENDLCYDIRSVIRTIQTEHRQLQLMGRIK